MRSSIYRTVREQRREKMARLAVDMPEAEIETLDQWAVSNGFATRAEAVRHLIKGLAQQTRAEA